MIRCYRKVYQFMNNGWFWLWTTALIYANELREMVSASGMVNLPIVTSSSERTYIVGDFAKENVVESRIMRQQLC